MQESTSKIFNIEELSGLSSDALLNILKKSWGYSSVEPFEIIGCLKVIKRDDNKDFFILEDLHSIHNDTILNYPLDRVNLRNTIFVGHLSKTLIQEGFGHDSWVSAVVELSPESERVKHSNPFSLKTIDGSLKLLQELPGEVGESTVAIDDANYVEKRVLDFYKHKYLTEITEEGEQLRVALQQLRAEEEEHVKTLLNNVETLSEQVDSKSLTLKNTTEQLESTLYLHDKAVDGFNQQQKIMEHKLSRLNHFIEQKASMLLDLDLITQDDFDNLLGQSVEQKQRVGHGFTDEFMSDQQRAVSYIQAFMHKKGIIYRRHVLEDFFALITTHDLIVLAGDSGSGKTNLVKSFAEAVGGKSIIIPVKPNWTSAEDLLGYYNPLEQKYLSTPFLNALFEAARNPDVPYFICLDEMNLARVEYYFADFLSLLEERGELPEIYLYSDSEAQHLLSETRNFLALIDDAKAKLEKPDLVSFLDLLRDESLNQKLHELCGFREGDSLLKYHAQLRRLMSNYFNTPSSIKLPPNVRIIGAINVDDTTHYLSPKILDRAHILRFTSPLLTDWSEAEAEVEEFDLDLNLPIIFNADALGDRVNYPEFDRQDPLVETLIHLVREYLEPLGIEFGLRTVRQARQYSAALKEFSASDELILNNIILHKVLPKLMFDGEKKVNGELARKDILIAMKNYLDGQLLSLDADNSDSCITELDRVIRNAEVNDWVVNYWSR